MTFFSPGPYGFVWGPLTVTRMATYEPKKGRRTYVLRLGTDHEELEIYVSKTGRSVRVFRAGKELS